MLSDEDQGFLLLALRGRVYESGGKRAEVKGNGEYGGGSETRSRHKKKKIRKKSGRRKERKEKATYRTLDCGGKA